MQRVRLGRSGIEVSRLGIGTGTAHPSGHCSQALMDKRELSELLLFAFDNGINFWDTAHQYKTYPHIREALKNVNRSDVVIATKLNTSNRKETISDFNYALRELDLDYIDVCLLHGIRTESEFRKKLGAIESLLEFRRKGLIRAVGFSSHGLTALKASLTMDEFDVVWARINHAGLCMDSNELNIYNRLASVPWIKSTANAVIPKKFISCMRPAAGSDRITKDEEKEIKEILSALHHQSKGIVGMKVLAEGYLGTDPKKAIEYVDGLAFIDSYIIGMMSENEIKANCRLAGNAL